MSLREADYRGILSFLDDLETANDLDSFMTTSVGRLHDLVAADVIWFQDVDFVYERPAHPKVTKFRAYHEFPEWPLPPDAAGDRGGVPRRLPPLLDPRLSAACTTPVGRDRPVCAPPERLLPGAVSPGGPRVRGDDVPSISRAASARRSRCHARRATSRIATPSSSRVVLPHLAYAFRRVRDHERAAETAATLEEVTTSIGLGVLVLGPGDRIEATIGRGTRAPREVSRGQRPRARAHRILAPRTEVPGSRPGDRRPAGASRDRAWREPG